MTQETLEEAAVINYKKLYEGEPLTQDVPIDAFKQGAKWQIDKQDNFAVGFAEWLLNERTGFNRETETKKLLEIYKKEN